MAATQTEAKRQSTGNRVATPKPGPAAGPVDLDTALVKAIGARVKLTTAAPVLDLEGTLFTACRLTNTIALYTPPTNAPASAPPASQPGDYHVIPISRVQTFNIVALAPGGTPKGFEGVRPGIARVDFAALKAREAQAVAKAKELERKRGVGVGREAQVIFDALDRTLPTVWDGPDMIVNDNVRIVAPYTPEDCSAAKGLEGSLGRVKKVLENERRKIAERAGKGGPPVGGVRKGG